MFAVVGVEMRKTMRCIRLGVNINRDASKQRNEWHYFFSHYEAEIAKAILPKTIHSLLVFID